MLVLLLAGGVTTFFVVRDNTTAAQSGGELFLEPASSTGADPFTQNVAQTLPVASVPTPSLPAVSPAPPQPSNPGVITVQTASGATPGLYGGTQNQSSCDRAQMARFLTANPDKANAWAAAQNSDGSLRWTGGTHLSPGQIPQYLSELTPIRLLADTRVTNNGFVNGQPTPHQSVLQAGTAVLVDVYGVPRARCACGNPLEPPIPLTTAPRPVGPPWPGYPGNVVVVNQSTIVINNFTLINIINGTPFTRPAGSDGTKDTPGPAPNPTAGPTPTTTVTVTVQPPAPAPTSESASGPVPVPVPTGTVPAPVPTAAPQTPLSVPPTISVGTGDVQATLLWTSSDDVDLHVTDPAGEDIYFGHRNSASGGQLDHDAIPGCGGGTETHIENIFWPTGGAPSGTYRVYALLYHQCTGGTPVSYELRVTVGGRVVYDSPGTLTAQDQQSAPFTFTR